MKDSIKRKLQGLIERHEEITALLGEADVISDQNKFRDLSKEYAQLEPLVEHLKLMSKHMMILKVPMKCSKKAILK